MNASAILLLSFAVAQLEAGPVQPPVDDPPVIETSNGAPPGYDPDFALQAAIEWTLLHELGHALVAEFDLPIAGSEESAVDGFASSRLAERHNDFEAADRLAATAQLWFQKAERNSGPDILGDHESDGRRAFRIACIAEEVSPDTGAELAAWAGFDADLYETCGDANLVIQAEAWDLLLADAFLSGGEPQSKVAVTYLVGGGETRERLVESGLVERIATEAARTYRWSGTLEFVGRECGVPEAYFDPDEWRIVLCYELVADLYDLARDDTED